MSNLVLDCIMKRRTVRNFKSDPLTEDQVTNLVQAALISPSAMNRQPWHLSVVQNPELISKLENYIIDYFKTNGPKGVAERNAERGNKVFYNAPAIFFISVAEENGLIDVGIMAQSINIAAKSMGLSSATLGLPQVAFIGEAGKAWKTRLKFPEGYEYGIAVAVGYSDAPPAHRDPDLGKVTFVE